jgi:hypothetical protein
MVRKKSSEKQMPLSGIVEVPAKRRAKPCAPGMWSAVLPYLQNYPSRLVQYLDLGHAIDRQHLLAHFLGVSRIFGHELEGERRATLLALAGFLKKAKRRTR